MNAARSASIAVLATCAALMVAACGASPGAPQGVQVVLDWTKNPAHSGLITTVAKGLDRAEGTSITLRNPPSSSDAARLLLSGRADLAVMDIHDLAIARERGRDLVAVMAVVGRPLSSLIAARDITRPRELQGRTVAVSGAPSDLAVTRSIVSADGGDPDKVRIAQSGFATTEALIGGKAQAATGFLNEEGVSLGAMNRGFHVFPLERWGAPAYPELVLVATHRKLDGDPEMIARVVRAFTAGTKAAVADPAATTALLQKQLQGADLKLLAARTKAALKAILPPNGKAGSLDPALMDIWAAWEVGHGIVDAKPDVAQLMTTRFSAR